MTVRHVKRTLERTRHHLLSQGEVNGSGPPVRSAVRASWDRCRDLRVDAENPTPGFQGGGGESTLARVAGPILDQVGQELVGEPVVIILTDATGMVLARRGGDRSLHRQLDRVHLAPGFVYSESQMGTNGIGTALESGRATLIEGGEHFAESLGAFACAGAPIKHPMTGQLLGVLDITSLVETSNALLTAFAKLSARRIAQAMLDTASVLERALLEDYYLVSQHSGKPVIALGNRVTMINEPARHSFTSADQVALLDHLREAVQTEVEHTAIADLPSGLTTRLTYRPSFAGEQFAGLVVQIQSLGGSAAGGTRRVTATRISLPHAPGRSDVWQRTAATLRHAATQREWTAVVGEPGAGKSSLIRAVSERVAPEQTPRVVDWHPEHPDAVVDDLAEALDDARTVLVPHVERLPAAVLGEVAGLLTELHDADAHDKPWVTVTIDQASSADGGLPSALVPLFGRSVHVPPLRLHVDDLPDIVDALLNALGCPTLTFTPDAMRQLARLPWPGNIRQLEGIVALVARDRRRGTVTAAELPSECHSVTYRRLSTIEALERDAIVGALSTHGSKAAAAESLGMSRATIYRKIRVYGITGTA